jgi:hypothetical protein
MCSLLELIVLPVIKLFFSLIIFCKKLNASLSLGKQGPPNGRPGLK